MPNWKTTLARPELEAHRLFLEQALPKLQADARISGILGAGSLITGRMDEYSDLDLVLAVEPEAFDSIKAERMEIAGSLGPLLSGFTGEHVGEPRLIICLYGPPALHVDLKFVSLLDLAKRVEEPVVLWARDERVPSVLAEGEGVYPQPDWKWIEDRFWVWIHYGASKIGRGELGEAVTGCGFLLESVLGPLSSAEAGARPNGMRYVERNAPERLPALVNVLSTYDPTDCKRGYEAAIELYLDLRERAARDGRLPWGFVPRTEAQQVAMEYLAGI
jgi:hypothetical protein